MGLGFSTRLLLVLTWAAALVCPVSSQESASSDYASRKAEVLAIANSKQIGPVVQAYNGDGIDMLIMDELLLDLDQDRDAAFRILLLIRVHELTDDESIKTTIFNSVKNIPFWLRPGEVTRVYWTENQMIMWMSAAFILKQRYPDDPDLVVGQTYRQRLVHYLTLKAEYGYSEFFSSVYLPYTMCGLLNLIDFSQDEEIRLLAEEAMLKLIDHILLATNDEGSFFAAAGRNYVGYYLDTFNQISETIWLLTGAGTKPTRIRHSTGFLSTSNFTFAAPIMVTDGSIDNITVFYSNSTSMSQRSGTTTRLPIRPSLQESYEINSQLERADRVVFQWSMGAYFNPEALDDSLWLFDEYGLWAHGEFGSVGDSVPTGLLDGALSGVLKSDLLRVVTAGSVLTGSDVVLYKNRELVLSSVQDFHSGRLGYQAYPWVATTGSLAVWTQAGPVADDWSDRPSILSNTHLPYLEQVDNVLLIVYDPSDDLDLIDQLVPGSPFSSDNKDVALRWPSEGFSSEAAFGNWKCGEETRVSDADGLGVTVTTNGYICVAMPCSDTTASGIPVCTDEHQMWVVIVGNDQMYGEFDEFTQKVQEEAIIKTEWRSGGDWWCVWCGDIFYGEVQFDGIVISHEMQED